MFTLVLLNTNKKWNTPSNNVVEYYLLYSFYSILIIIVTDRGDVVEVVTNVLNRLIAITDDHVKWLRAK